MSEATEQLRRGIELGNPESMLDALAPGAFLSSPAARGLRFEGREELAHLFAATTEAYQDIQVTHDFGNGDSWVIAFKARVNRQSFHETLLLDLADDGRITALTALIRPMSGTAVVASAVGRRLARRHGRIRELALAFLTAPLVAGTRSSDKLGPKLLGPRGDT